MKKLAVGMITLLVLGIAAVAFGLATDYYQRHFHRSIVEAPEHPIYIQKIEDSTLVSTTGSVVHLPQVDRIPALPGAVERDLYKYGVEAKAGKYFGLFRIHHWCGDDPVGYHLARVDLSSLCALIDSHSLRVTPYGIDPGSYLMAQMPVQVIRESRP